MPVKRRETGRQTSTGGSGDITLRELLDRVQRGPWRDVKSWQTLLSNVKFLNERLGDHLLGAINAETLEGFAVRMYEQGYAPATIKRRLDTLGRALSVAVRWGLIPAKPAMPEVKIRNTKDRVLAPAEEVAVLEAIRLRELREPWRHWDEFKDLVVVLLQTGARLGEIINLRAADIQPGLVTFGRYQTKNDKPRTIPLTASAQQALDRRVDQTCDAKGGCKIAPLWSFTETKAWFFWAIIRKDIGGLDEITLHTLRHTALTRLAQGGMDLMRLQKWAGHSDPRITAERYTHLQPSDLLGGLDILERKTT